jgi:hypothetical protein
VGGSDDGRLSNESGNGEKGKVWRKGGERDGDADRGGDGEGLIRRRDKEDRRRSVSCVGTSGRIRAEGEKG